VCGVCLGRVQGQCTIEQKIQLIRHKPASAPLTQGYRHRALLRCIVLCLLQTKNGALFRWMPVTWREDALRAFARA
jgi:hypothetical protein